MTRLRCWTTWNATTAETPRVHIATSTLEDTFTATKTDNSHAFIFMYRRCREADYQAMFFFLLDRMRGVLSVRVQQCLADTGRGVRVVLRENPTIIEFVVAHDSWDWKLLSTTENRPFKINLHMQRTNVCSRHNASTGGQNLQFLPASNTFA